VWNSSGHGKSSVTWVPWFTGSCSILGAMGRNWDQEVKESCGGNSQGAWRRRWCRRHNSSGGRTCRGGSDATLSDKRGRWIWIKRIQIAHGEYALSGIIDGEIVECDS